MVKWLQRLGYGAESRSKVVSLRMGFAMGDWKTQEMGTFFELGKAKAAEGEGWVRLSSTVPKIQWDSSPHCPYGF